MGLRRGQNLCSSDSGPAEWLAKPAWISTSLVLRYRGRPVLAGYERGQHYPTQEAKLLYPSLADQQ